MNSFKGKLALVTGASTGIGYAIAKELAKRGANLIISATARSEDKLHELSSEIKDIGAECHIFLEDLSRSNSGRSLYNRN
jgi:Short-chain dehydrogenases of various substrate specificities